MLNFFNTYKDYVVLWREFKGKGILTRNRYFEIVRSARKRGKHPVEILLENDQPDPQKTLDILSGFYSIPNVLLRNKVIAPRTIKILPKEISEQHNIVIFKKIKKEVHVAIMTPDTSQIIRFIRKKTGYEPKVFFTTKEDIKIALNVHKRDIKEDFEIILSQASQSVGSESSGENAAQFVPVIKMVNSIVEKGITSKASDIHIEPNNDKVYIRFRVDGILKKIVDLPITVLPALAARIKIMSGLKIDEHMIPQDGRFLFNYKKEEYALRVSVIPTLYGPKIALRILEMKQKMHTLYKLGFNRQHQQLIKQAIMAPQGMILATGPTGSGKTTTLYTLLGMLNTEDKHICTIEDPIEYGMANVNQMQVKPQVGLNFAEGLRALMRQDPNIIMVGEIRDPETAKISVNAAMTGHLVLSTLHTNNAFLTPQRLGEFGIPSYLLSSVINIVIGQRLVRKLCRHCRVKVRQPEKLIKEYETYWPISKSLEKLRKSGLLEKDISLENISIYRQKGCPKCQDTGYEGRFGIYEVLPIENGLRKVIMGDASETVLKEYLGDNAMTMAEDGLLKVVNGETTIEEVLRVTKDI